MKIELWEESINIYLLDIDISKEQKKMTSEQINELLEIIQKQFLKMEKVANVDIYDDGEYSESNFIYKTGREILNYIKNSRNT